MNKKLIVSGIFVAICSISLAQASASDMYLAHAAGEDAAGIIGSVAHKLQPKKSYCAYFACRCGWYDKKGFSVACENGQPIADPNNYLEKRCRDSCGKKTPTTMKLGKCEWMERSKCDVTHT